MLLLQEPPSPLYCTLLIKPASRDIINLNLLPHEGVDKHTDELLNIIFLPTEIPPISTVITMAHFCQGWKKKKDHTFGVTSDISFGMLKYLIHELNLDKILELFSILSLILYIILLVDKRHSFNYGERSFKNIC